MKIKALKLCSNYSNSIVSRDSFMEYLWHTNWFVDDRTLTVNITRLRKKLDEIGIENLIETRRGLGYIIS
ncbi:winged helix-turn-helix domain-containing protein [Clostridioides difficile]